MKIGIIGAGAWGSALAILSQKAGNSVTLWSFDGNFTQFDGVNMPADINICRDPIDLTDTEIWLVATPAAFFRETILKFKPAFNNQSVIICTKGIEPITNKFMSEVLAEELPACANYGVLSGPQFAAEAACGVPTGSTLATNGTKALADGHLALNTLYLEDSNDVIGAEICGVGKNAIALIMGYVGVTAGGENEKAMILTRAWGEVADFGTASGAHIETFLKLCGIGDLFLSATSPTSRNYAAGIAVANGEKIVGTVEGVSALNGLIIRATAKKVNMPTLSEFHKKLAA